MRRRGRKHVDDAAAHREFTAVHHQVGAGVGVFDKSFFGSVEAEFVTLTEHERLYVLDAGDDRLDERSHGHHEDANGREQRVARLGMRQTVEHRHALRHGVGTGRQPLMRQRLPCIKHRHVARIAVIPRADGSGGVLGVASGRHDEHDLA